MQSCPMQHVSYSMNTKNESLDQHIDALIKRLACHHLETYQHSCRVSEYSGMIAREELPEKEQVLRYGALVHDIGKIFLPRELLMRTRITPEEYELIKDHTRKGYDTLYPWFPEGACIAGKHHPTYAVPEYPPEIINRKEIDNLVSMVTIADFFDALTTRDNAFNETIDTTDNNQLFETMKQSFPNAESRIELLIDNNPYNIQRYSAGTEKVKSSKKDSDTTKKPTEVINKIVDVLLLLHEHK